MGERENWKGVESRAAVGEQGRVHCTTILRARSGKIGQSHD